MSGFLGDPRQADPVRAGSMLCDLAVEELGLAGAALSLYSDVGRRLLCATGPAVVDLEEAQDRFGQGPSLEALASGIPALIDDVEDESRWPWFTERAREVGAHAVYAFSFGAGALRFGVLSGYRTEPGELDTPALETAVGLADAAAHLLTRSHGEGILDWVENDGAGQWAEVPQAVGITMVRSALDASGALAVLHARAYTLGTSLGELSCDIVAGRYRLEDDRAAG